MADKKDLSIPEALRHLHQSLSKKIADFADVALALRKKETEAIEKFAKSSPPGRKKEVEKLKAKGLPAHEAFGIAWKQADKVKKDEDGTDDMSMSECTGEANCKCTKCEGAEKWAKSEPDMKKKRNPGGLEKSDDKNGYHVETYGGGKHTSIAWYKDKGSAEKHVKKIKDSGGWRGMPPRVTPGRDLSQIKPEVKKAEGQGKRSEAERKAKGEVTDAEARKKADDGAWIQTDKDAKLPGTPKEVPSEADEGSGGQIEKGPKLGKAMPGMGAPGIKPPKVGAAAPKVGMPKAATPPMPKPPKPPGMAAPAMKAEDVPGSGGKPDEWQISNAKATKAGKKGVKAVPGDGVARASGEGRPLKERNAVKKADLAPGTVLQGMGTKVPGVGHKAPATSAPKVQTMVERVASKLPTVAAPKLPGAHLFGKPKLAEHMSQLPTTKAEKKPKGKLEKDGEEDDIAGKPPVGGNI